MSLLARPVRIRLRGGKALRGRVHVAEGQSLAAFLASKRYFLNLTEVYWESEGEPEVMSHLSVRIPRIAWVEPLDASLPLSSAVLPSEHSRQVELHVGSGQQLRVRLNLAPETRMSDYLEANPSFIPLWAVHVVGEPHVVERAAINQEAIEAVREMEEDVDPGRSD